MTNFLRKDTNMNLNEGLLYYLSQANPREDYFYLILYAVLTAVVIIVSYLLGSINTAIVVSKLVYKDDIRRHGSGNAGLTNMLRTYGKGAAGLTLLGDVMKTVIAVLFAAFFFGFHYVRGVSDYMGVCYLAGLGVVIGHIFPIYYKFKGGKGVLATASMALILSPVPFLFLLLIFIIMVAWSKYVSLGSVTVAVLYPVVLTGYFKIVGVGVHGLISLSSIILAILIVWCHRENLERISNRTERKISFRKKKPEPEIIDDDDDDDE